MSTIDTHDIPKYRKKSSKKGQPRSNHKHEYIEVALISSIRLGSNNTVDVVSLAEVCKICGRVGRERFFSYKVNNKELTQTEVLSQFPHWYKDNFTDKFAYSKKMKQN